MEEQRKLVNEAISRLRFELPIYSMRQIKEACKNAGLNQEQYVVVEHLLETDNIPESEKEEMRLEHLKQE